MRALRVDRRVIFGEFVGLCLPDRDGAVVEAAEAALRDLTIGESPASVRERLADLRRAFGGDGNRAESGVQCVPFASLQRGTPIA